MNLWCCFRSSSSEHTNSFTGNKVGTSIQAIEIKATGSWYRAIEVNLSKLPPGQRNELALLAENGSLHDALDYLADEYAKSGLSSKLQSIEPILNALNGFGNAITVLVQAGPTPLQILWGSTLLLIKGLLRHQQVLDNVTQMLNELGSSMPRFESYLELFPTTQLRRIMRQVYGHYIEFCFTAAKFLYRRPYKNWIRSYVSTMESKLEKARSDIQRCSAEFEAEVRFAHAQASAKWQDDMRSKLSGSTLQPSNSGTVSTVPFPRNHLFCGKDLLLQKVSDLLHHYAADSTHNMRSVALCGMGGCGKTQVALEYTYRYRHVYSHVFWIKAETEPELAESFELIAKAIGGANEGDEMKKSINCARSWLDTCSQRWLLVFDNVSSLSSLRRYWPQSQHGAIIITSQKRNFDTLVSAQYRVLPLTAEEGGQLILRQLRLPDSAREEAECLAMELGGLPLAIAHYAGYAATSQMTLTELLQTTRQRAVSADIWSNHSGASFMNYDRTLDSVWNVALDKLDPKSRELLNILAFFNADYIPEEMLISDAALMPVRAGLSKSFNLHLMVSDLTRRNLIERNIEGQEPFLRLHRALQLFLLFKLDEQPGLRQSVFECALSIVRSVFPSRSLVTRKRDLNAKWKKYVPQVLSLQMKFDDADHGIEPKLEFAHLLGDAGGFLYELMLPKSAMSVLYLAEKIAKAILGENEPSPILAHIETFLASLEEEQNVENRPSSNARRKKVIDLQERYYATLPPDKLSTEEQVNLARAWNDYGCALANMEDFEGADHWQSKALAHYRKIAPDEAKLRFRFALQYGDLAITRVGQDRLDEAMDLAERSCQLCEEELGKDDLATARLGSWAAFVYFSCGQVQRAIDKHNEVLQTRIELSDEDNVDVRTSYYWVGAVYYHMGQTIAAEAALKRALEHYERSGWGKNDIGRAQFCLSRVLRDLHRHDEAEALEQEAIKSLPEMDQHIKPGADLARVFDQAVWIGNGRSTGPFHVRCGKRFQRP